MYLEAYFKRLASVALLGVAAVLGLAACCAEIGKKIAKTRGRVSPALSEPTTVSQYHPDRFIG